MTPHRYRPLVQTRSSRLRRLIGPVLAATLLAASLVGCGDPSAIPSGAAASSRSVDSAYGEATVPGTVGRVVALSADWLGTMLAIKAPVVGYRTDGPAAEMPPAPWLQETLPKSSVRVTGAGDGIVEKVAALKPDLIVGPKWLVTRELADKLKVFAPVVVDDDSGAGTSSGSWERQLATAGMALGVATEPTRNSIKEQIRAAAGQHPSIAGKTFAVAVAGGNGQIALTSNSDASASKFLGALGMRLATIPGASSQQRTVVSAENARELDRAFLLIVGSTPAGLNDIHALVAQRPQSSPLLNADLPLLNAFNIPDASSIPVLLKALDGVLPR